MIGARCSALLLLAACATLAAAQRVTLSHLAPIQPEDEALPWSSNLTLADVSHDAYVERLLEQHLLSEAARRGGATEGNTLAATCIKCFVVYIVDNELYVEPHFENANTLERFTSSYHHQGAVRREEVLAPLYEALAELSAYRVRFPNTRFLLTLSDRGHDDRRGTLSFSVSRSTLMRTPAAAATHNTDTVDDESTDYVALSDEQSLNFLLPAPEFVRPRVAADVYPRAPWLLRARFGRYGVAESQRDATTDAHTPVPSQLDNATPPTSLLSALEARVAAKRAQAVWRGQPIAQEGEHTYRQAMVRRALTRQDLFNAHLYKRGRQVQSKSLLFAEPIAFAAFGAWRAQLDVDGAGWSSALLHKLLSECVVLKMRSNYDDLLSRRVTREGVHYVPFEQDMSDLVAKAEMILQQWTPRQTAEFILRTHKALSHFTWDRIKLYWLRLLLQYAQLQQYSEESVALSVPERARREGSYVPCCALYDESSCHNRRQFYGLQCEWKAIRSGSRGGGWCGIKGWSDAAEQRED